MSNGTWETKPNTGSAFKARQNETGDFTGEADIDGDKFRVTIEAEDKGAKHTTREAKFVGETSGLTFAGKLFDNRRDSATGQEKQINEKAPRWRGKVKAAVSDEMTVEKQVSIWEKPLKKKEGIWLSLSISDPYTGGQSQSQGEASEDTPF